MAQDLDTNLENKLYEDVCSVIDETRLKVAVYVNSEACLLNWNVGKRIKEDILFNQRAEYGEQILKRLSKRLTNRFGKGWGFQKLQHCVRAAYTIKLDSFKIFNVG